MEKQLLCDQNMFPADEVLEKSLARVYPVYESLMKTITNADYGLGYEWIFYKDSKSWLCKVCQKKKTIFWLSVWEGYFQIVFYFTEKHLESIVELDINKKIKDDFCQTKPIGKLLPMIFKISRKEQLNDLLKVIELKKNLK